jgi:acid phosphatase (class A)
VLNEADLRPYMLLPMPPARGSAEEAIELAEVHRIVAAATPARMLQARWDDSHEDPSIFDAQIGGGFQVKSFPATWELLKMVQNEGDVAAGFGKKYFNRIRPWGIDKTLAYCDSDKPNAKPLNSYPSGHSTLAFSVGIVMSNLMPEKATVIMARANDYAFSREVCGVHFPADTDASRILGAVVASRMLTAPAMQEKIAAARAELRAAKMTAS